MANFQASTGDIKTSECDNSIIMNTITPQILVFQIQDAHARTLALINGLSDQQLMGPRLPIVNPLLWEIAHAAYFYEFFLLRSHLKEKPVRNDEDELYNSMTIAHNDRWDLPLPPIAETLQYIQSILESTQFSLSNGSNEQRDYLAQYAIYHHDMHNEAFTYTRQTLDYPAPEISKPNHRILDAGRLTGDSQIPGGQFQLGAREQDGFVFDNEKWANEVAVKPFSISRAAVSNADFLKFIEADGYKNPAYWENEGLEWLQQSSQTCPLYWRNSDFGWQLKEFDEWKSLPLNAALIHVNWFEAQAYCKWARRRLPTELEWEVAAAAEPSADGQSLSSEKRYYPWGNQPPTQEYANLDGYALGTNDVAAHASGDSAFGCRQMIGNVWEWTATDFAPYPGFVPDMYEDYSQPLFGNTKVLRGGAWTTRGRMIRNTWRSYYGPERNDVFAGFRTCALE